MITQAVTLQAGAFGSSVFDTRSAQPALFHFDHGNVDECRDEPVDGSRDTSSSWSEVEIETLYGEMFDVCVQQLKDPQTPLEEVIDWLRWVASDPGKEDEPFSFSAVMRRYRRPRVREIQEQVRSGARQYIAARLAHYPRWAAEAFWRDPDDFVERLEKNPQWINEVIREQKIAGDLFAM